MDPREPTTDTPTDAMSDVLPVESDCALASPLDVACDAFEAAWQRGESPCIEDFLDAAPDDVTAQLVPELVSIELYWRRRRGETPDAADYAQRFGQHAETLRHEVDDEAATLPHKAATGDYKATTGGRANNTAANHSRFGNYDLLETIGQGGMGTVYRARQRNADRIVALKVVRADLLNTLPEATQQSIIERFNHEVQAAARMDDEHIVTVYEVGNIDGQHFFSMRYVEGKSLSDKLRDGPLAPQVAARYLQPVARALHKAHELGILHRDIKPQNILIEASTDIALVADFGLAKLNMENQELTRTGEVLGTPPYMSPEQAQDSGSVGPESDTYSVGATLYHLLTGRPPFQAATALDTLRQVLDDDPVEPRRLNAAVDRDIDTICMKCLQKEPGRRYATSQALADDLQRYLNGEPIQARPLGYTGRFARWCRRNPAVASLTTAAFVFLALAVVFLVVGQINTRAALKVAEENRVRAEENFKEAEVNRQRAEDNFEHARDAVDNFYTSVSEHTLLKQDGMQPLRADLLKKALEYDQNFLAERSTDASQRERVAASHFRVAEITELIGSLDDALASYQKAREMYQQFIAQHPSDAEMKEKLGNTLSAMGRVAHRSAHRDDARKYHQQAREIREELTQAAPTNQEYRRCLANTHMNLGLLEKDSGNAKLAEEFLVEAQRIRRELLADHPDFEKARRDSGMGYFNLASLQLTTGNLAAAEATLIDAIAEFERVSASDSGDLENQWRLAICYRLRGDLKLHQKEIATALPLYEQAGELIERLSRANPDVPKYRVEFSGLQMNLGHLYASQGDTQQAIAALIRARDFIEPLIDENTDVPRYRRDFALTHLMLAQQQARAKDYESAKANVAVAEQRLRDLLETFPDDADLQRQASQVEKLAKQLAEHS